MYCMLTETILIGFIRCHTATLEEVKIPAVVLDNESAGFHFVGKYIEADRSNLVSCLASTLVASE